MALTRTYQHNLPHEVAKQLVDGLESVLKEKYVLSNPFVMEYSSDWPIDSHMHINLRYCIPFIKSGKIYCKITLEDHIVAVNSNINWKEQKLFKIWGGDYPIPLLDTEVIAFADKHGYEHPIVVE